MSSNFTASKFLPWGTCKYVSLCEFWYFRVTVDSCLSDISMSINAPLWDVGNKDIIIIHAYIHSTYIRMYVCVRACVHIYIHTYIHTSHGIHKHTPYIHTPHTYIHTPHTYVHIHTPHTYTPYIHTYIHLIPTPHTYIHAYIHRRFT